MQISIYVINNMPEPGRNLAADACMGRTQLSPCIYNFSTRTIRASRNAMPAWYFFHAEPLISRFSLEKYITLLQQLWQTVLMWNLYPILISLNQLAVKITPAESFLWMHLHQFQYLLHVYLMLFLSDCGSCRYCSVVVGCWVDFIWSYCPACRTTLIATRFWVVMICPIIKCLTVIRVFFYFVWFVFIHHNFQFYYELCTYCDILDIYLS